MSNLTARAVIGAGYGDEGKGLAVDAISAELAGRGRAVTVVRSNGGAQAGHTVTAPDGRRHVFHHVGSGSFPGAGTHLSRFFVAHPMVFGHELQDLAGLGLFPSVSIDPRAAVTTPFDMLINQVVETARSGGRHGSCGMGFGETLERTETGPRLTVADLARPGLAGHLRQIRGEWVPRRLAALGVTATLPAHVDALRSDALIDRFVQDCLAFLDNVRLRSDATLGASGAIVFEGAQGLKLDQDFGDFPHVTRSHTGLRNMLAIAAEAGIDAMDPLYMSRVYTTRHGAGPLVHEVPRLEWAEVLDATNMPNTWQGSLRFAPLDPASLGTLIRRDLALAAGSGIRVTPAMGLTCLDQVTGTARIRRGDRDVEVAPEALGQTIADDAGLPLHLLSRGPSRDRVDMTPDAGRRADRTGSVAAS